MCILELTEDFFHCNAGSVCSRYTLLLQTTKYLLVVCLKVSFKISSMKCLLSLKAPVSLFFPLSAFYSSSKFLFISYLEQFSFFLFLIFLSARLIWKYSFMHRWSLTIFWYQILNIGVFFSCYVCFNYMHFLNVSQPLEIKYELYLLLRFLISIFTK